jgi:hypothetical protein
MDLSLNSSTRRKQPSLKSVVFFVLAATLLIAVIGVELSKRQLRVSIETLDEKRLALEAEKQRRQDRVDRAGVDRQTLKEVLRACQNAAELPNFGGERIISVDVSGEQVAMWLPEGDFRLAIEAKWTASDEKQAANVVPGSYSKQIELAGGRGYQFALWHSRKDPGVMRWRLESNDEAFAKRQEELPLPKFRQIVVSWSPRDHVLFPNQVGSRERLKLRKDNWTPAPLVLANWNRYGEGDEAELKLNVVVNLYSEADPVVAADTIDLGYIKMRYDELEYLGDGRYAVW